MKQDIKSKNYDVLIRAKWDNNSQIRRWEEIKTIFGEKNNAKAFKKLVENSKL